MVGLGYIGLPTAAVLANHGVQVIGLDVNSDIIETINRGQIHIVEPELGIMVHNEVKAGRLSATLDAEPAQAFIIAVPTPLMANHQPDLSYIKLAAKTIAPVLEKNNLVILESTSPVGTTEKLAEWLAEERNDLSFPQQKGELSDIQIAHCPERVLPGHVVKELVNNSRIIGGMTSRCGVRAAALYKIFVKGKCLLTKARIAELAKLTENSYRDVNIAFANELSLICDKLDINVWELIQMANQHPRVNILQPGPGVGGHCIAVDPWFIVDSAPKESRLIKTAREVNDFKPKHVIDKVRSKASKFKNPVIACLGLTFKADIDDLRGSPCLDIVSQLAEQTNAQVLTVEPHIGNLPETLEALPNVQLASLERALTESDIILLLVNHQSFLNIDRSLLQEKIVIDTRGILK